MPLRRRDANAKQLNVRMPPDELKSLDVWIKTQPAPRPTRAEAIRRLVGQALAGGAQPSQKRSKKSAAKAREMAGQAIDRLLGDAGSLPVEGESAGLQKGLVNFAKFAATSPSRRAEAQGFEAVLLAGKNRYSRMLPNLIGKVTEVSIF
jgi:hypothetical protein